MYLKSTKKISLILFSVAALLVCSCRENPKTEETTTPTTQSETTAPVKKEVTPASSPDGVALNPAHGQPGHRCDIAVGTPLNSTPAPAKTNNETSDVVLDAGTSLPAGTLNPAHGQPGHRCDVKVGDPL
jgi:hypothetical protein